MALLLLLRAAPSAALLCPLLPLSRRLRLPHRRRVCLPPVPGAAARVAASTPPAVGAEKAADFGAARASREDEGSLQWVGRTDYCGELAEADAGRRVRLCGWVAQHRVHGGVTFVNLRDCTGIVQV